MKSSIFDVKHPYIEKSDMCLREDVFAYLVSKGIDEKEAFRIAEQVRTGKGISGDEQQMLKHKGVPDWYINSCNKIRYLLPKTHCISYALNMWKLAYFKIHYQKEFYEENVGVFS